MAKAVKSSEHQNAMDYAEHENTYAAFLWLTKWTVAICLALLVAMALGFFGGMGLVGGILVFVILMAVSLYLI
ncbi:MAG: aa3-type cytochrome c oxidase subunit IV [Rhizobiaceae bacterium]